MLEPEARQSTRQAAGSNGAWHPSHWCDGRGGSDLKGHNAIIKRIRKEEKKTQNENGDIKHGGLRIRNSFTYALRSIIIAFCLIAIPLIINIYSNDC